MKWLEIKVNTTQEASDAVSEAMTQAGAGGVAIEDPFDIRQVVETPGSLDYADAAYLDSLGEDVIVKAYFSSLMNRAELTAAINEKISNIAKYLDIGKGTVDFSEVDEEDWSENWKKYYKPFRLSERIVIKPSWENFNEKPGDLIIEMDPGMAFGTGTHDTTRMCALLLEKFMAGGESVIDLGCGSGILSIIAAKLGAGEVTAIDIDKTAVKVSKENCVRNKADDRVKCLEGQIGDLPGIKADIMVANIIASVIIGISDKVSSYLAPGAVFITSGIIKERGEEVKAAYARQGYTLIDELYSGEWVAMAFKCQDSL